MIAGIALAFLAVGAPRAVDLQPIPDLHARVTDTTGTLSAQQTQTLEQELAALEHRKGAQMAVLMVPTTEPEDIAQYAIRVFDQWKLGRKGIDDGVLLIVAKNDHRMRIEVARGLEGAIPDAAAARIIREYLTPRFRSGDFFGGIDAGVGALTKLIDGEPLPAPAPAASGHRWFQGNILPALFVAFLVGKFLLGLCWRLPAAARAGTIGMGTGAIAWWMGGGLAIAALAAILGIIFGWIGLAGGAFAHRSGYGGWSGGGFGGGGFGGGSGSGFSGGGGVSAGGGASGSW
ncbi:MAG: TPM domain-containing protein [Rhodanobacteraceae bacterium]